MTQRQFDVETHLWHTEWCEYRPVTWTGITLRAMMSAQDDWCDVICDRYLKDGWCWGYCGLTRRKLEYKYPHLRNIMKKAYGIEVENPLLKVKSIGGLNYGKNQYYQ